MDPLRKTALVAGIFYLITFISIPTLVLYGTVKTDQGWVTGSGSSTGVLWGGLLEVIVALAGIGTAVTLFPVVKRQNEGMALGFAAVRTLEAAMIFTGVGNFLYLRHHRRIEVPRQVARGCATLACTSCRARSTLRGNRARP